MVTLQLDSVDHGHAWLVMVGSLVQNMMCSSMFSASAVYMLDWMELYNVSTTQVATVSSLLVACGCIAGVPVGILVDKFGPKPVSMIGATLCITALIMTAFAPSFWVIYFTYGILLGVGESFASMPPILSVQYYFEKKRPFAAGISLAGHSLGTMLFLPFLRILISHYGLRGAMLLHAGLVAHIYATSLLYWPIVTMKFARKKICTSNHLHDSNATVTSVVYCEEEITKNLSKNGQTDGSLKSIDKNPTLKADSFNKNHIEILKNTSSSDNIKLNQANADNARQSFSLKQYLHTHIDFQLLKHLPFLLYMIATVLDEYCIALMYNMTSVKANKDAGMDKLHATLLVSFIGTFSTTSRLVSSFIVNTPCLNRIWYLGVSMLMMGIVTAGSCAAWDFTSFAVSMALFGVFLGAHFTVKSTVLTDLIGLDRIAQGIGFEHFFLALSAFSQLSVAGWIIDFTQDYDLPYYIYGGIQIVAGLTMLAILCVHKDPKKTTTSADKNVEEKITSL